MELERLAAQTAATIRSRFETLELSPGKYSLWLKFVRLTVQDGIRTEEATGPIRKLLVTTHSLDDLIGQLAEQLVLTVFGSEVQVVPEMPNLIVKLLDQKVHVHTAGAPALDAAEQVWLKATLYRQESSLWGLIFRN